jgi:hypothetical protein
LIDFDRFELILCCRDNMGWDGRFLVVIILLDVICSLTRVCVSRLRRLRRRRVGYWQVFWVIRVALELGSDLLG